MTLFPPVAPAGYVWTYRLNETGAVVETFGNPCPPGLIAVADLDSPRLVLDAEARVALEKGMANYYRMIGCKR
jgi:hypothetical protein